MAKRKRTKLLLEQCKMLGFFPSDKEGNGSQYVAITTEQAEQIKNTFNVEAKIGVDGDGNPYDSPSVNVKCYSVEKIPVYTADGVLLENGMAKIPFGIADIIISSYEWTYQKRSGISLSLLAVRLIESGDDYAGDFTFSEPEHKEPDTIAEQWATAPDVPF